jgi:mevalonate kinase
VADQTVPEVREFFAPGKVILLGEHAVVYGHTALAAPLSRGITARATLGGRCELELPKSLRSDSRKAVQAAFTRAAVACGHPPVSVKLEGDLPISVGLGSSAAASVACALALTDAARMRGTPRQIMSVAHQMEQVFHGSPSGVDAACSTMNRLISFRRKNAESTPRIQAIELPRPLEMIVAIVGERGPTHETVGALRERVKRWPTRYLRVLTEIGRVAHEGIEALRDGDLNALGDAMNVNHGLLSALQLTSPDIDEMVQRLRGLGALGAKVTGAGGRGGAVIGLFRETQKPMARLSRDGVSCFASRVRG